MAFSLLYLGLCRIFGVVVSCRRTESDRDIEIMVLRHQVHVLERQLHTRVRYRPSDRAILAALSRLLPRSRWRSFLVTPTPCCDGIEKQPSTSGGGGENNEALADRL
jgi:putative transposase